VATKGFARQGSAHLRPRSLQSTRAVVGCPLRSSFEQQVAEHVGTLPGVTSVALEFGVMTPDERAALDAGRMANSPNTG